MKKFYQLTLLLVALLTTTLSSSAYDFEVDGIYYNITTETTTTVTYIGESSGDITYVYSGDVIIPEQVTFEGVTYTVTTIGNSAFQYSTGLTSVVIPNTITSIERYAFNNCSGLTTITIPSSVTTIGIGAFNECTTLTSIELSNGISSIGNFAFDNCSGLATITIPSSVTSIGVGAFSGCSGLESIVVDSGNSIYDSRDNCNAIIEKSSNQLIAGCNNTIIPNTVTSIGQEAFRNCKGLTTVELPNSMVTIGYRAFQNCNGITKLTIPNSVGTIAGDAFQNCSGITELTIPNSVTSIGYYAFENCTGLKTVNYNAKYYGNFGGTVTTEDIEKLPLFKGCTSLETLTIGEDVQILNYCAFRGCTGLKTVNYNATNCRFMGLDLTTSTLAPVFSQCSSITTLNIGENVQNIPYGAFYGLTGVTEVTIPESVVNFGCYSFAGCSNLATVNYNATNCQYIQYAQYKVFSGCNALSTVNIGENVTIIPNTLFQNCTGLTTINFSNSLTQISQYAFGGCTSLTSIEIPNSATIIESNAFNGCTGLTSVKLSEALTWINNMVFRGCTGLTTFNVPSSVTSFSSTALYGCTGLTEITVAEDNTAFCSVDGVIYTKDKTKLVLYPASREGSEYTILDSVTLINNYAFSGCKYLSTIAIPENVIAIGEGTFANCESVTDFVIPTTVVEVGMNAFTNSGWYNNQADGLLYLDNWCLGYKGELSGAIAINEGTRGIAAGSFYNCSSLTDVTIPNTLEMIGYSAFSSCTGLTKVVIPNSVTSIGNYAFDYCTALTDVTLPNSLSEICDYLFSQTSIESITIPSTVTKIGERAFNQTKLKTIDIPDLVTEIGDYAFYYCDSLTTINLGSSVNSLGNQYLSSNYRLSSINVSPENETFSSIDGVLFNKDQTEIIQYPMGRESVHYYVPNTVKLIRTNAFYDCSGISAITLPKSVEEIEYQAFNWVSNLTSLTSLNPTPPTCYSRSFGFIRANPQVKVPEGSLEAYSTADIWCNFIDNMIEIPVVEVETQESNATFDIPMTEGAATYTVNVYSDEAMTQLVATTEYDAEGNIIPMSTSIELSIDGLADGRYYYDVIAKSESGEALINYTGNFDIGTTGVDGVESVVAVTEVGRYDVNGRLLSEPVPGVNIVVYSDGSTRKEIIR